MLSTTASKNIVKSMNTLEKKISVIAADFTGGQFDTPEKMQTAMTSIANARQTSINAMKAVAKSINGREGLMAAMANQDALDPILDQIAGVQTSSSLVALAMSEQQKQDAEAGEDEDDEDLEAPIEIDSFEDKAEDGEEEDAEPAPAPKPPVTEEGGEKPVSAHSSDDEPDFDEEAGEEGEELDLTAGDDEDDMDEEDVKAVRTATASNMTNVASDDGLEAYFRAGMGV